MTELFYPYDDAPLIPVPTAETSSVQQVAGEWLPVIDENAFVIGRATRSYCHSGAKPLHPVIHIHIIDRFSRIYLQKRSAKKEIQPGKWDTAVGGHLSYGEGVVEAAYREASEELGLTAFHPVFLKSYIFESEIEKEYVTVFAAVGSFDLHPDADETDGGDWWKIEDIDAALGTGVFTPNFELEYVAVRKSLLALL